MESKLTINEKIYNAVLKLSSLKPIYQFLIILAVSIVVIGSVTTLSVLTFLNYIDKIIYFSFALGILGLILAFLVYIYVIWANRINKYMKKKRFYLVPTYLFIMFSLFITALVFLILTSIQASYFYENVVITDIMLIAIALLMIINIILILSLEFDYDEILILNYLIIQYKNIKELSFSGSGLFSYKVKITTKDDKCYFARINKKRMKRIQNKINNSEDSYNKFS